MIGIVDYGMGNLRSVQKALEYLGERTTISSDREELSACGSLILPGVGSFGAGMDNLKRACLVDFLKEYIQERPLLGICLGMQFLLDESEEEGLFEGLGVIGGSVKRFTCGKVPHMGWNSVFGLRSPLFQGIGEGTQFYFVHSYYARSEFAIAHTDYYGTFASAVGKGNAYGVQFHPEKSGDAGLQLLRNFTRLST